MPGNKYIKNASGQLTEEASVQTSAGAGDAGKIVALNGSGKIDDTMLEGAEATSIEASENLSAGDFVNIFDDAGTTKVRKADASGGNAKKADGYVKDAVTSGQPATVYFGNINADLSGLTKGAIYYVSATPGAITTTAPSTAAYIVQRVGKAISATELLVEIQDTLVLA